MPKYLSKNKPEQIKVEKRPVWAFEMDIALLSWCDSKQSRFFYERDNVPYHFGWYANPDDPTQVISLADQEEEKDFGKFIIERLSKDPYYYNRVKERFLRSLESLEDLVFFIAKETRQGKLTKYSFTQLKNLFSHYQELALPVNLAYDFPFYFTRFVVEKVAKNISQEEFKILSTHALRTLVGQEKRFRIERAAELKEKGIKKYASNDKVLVQILETYLLNYGFRNERLKVNSSLSTVFSVILGKKDPKRELKKFKTEIQQEQEAMAKIIKKYRHKELFKWIFWMRELLSFRNTETEYFWRHGFLLAEFLALLALEIEVKLEDFQYIGFFETGEALKKQENLSGLVAERREKGITIAYKKGKVITQTGLDQGDKRLLAAVTNFQKRELEKMDKEVIKGDIAYPGRVRGKVLIVSNPLRVKIPPKPFILVAPNTDPNFMPLIGKCLAVVTDEGGILSHAAIVSRELKKPTIIGTKFATQILKTGDLVEVDAEKGIVKILKREK
jgi:phosphohistidine swiveling domain-containing protein